MFQTTEKLRIPDKPSASNGGNGIGMPALVDDKAKVTEKRNLPGSPPTEGKKFPHIPWRFPSFKIAPLKIKPLGLRLKLKPLDLGQNAQPKGVLIFILIASLITSGTFGILFTREVSLRRGTVAELVQVQLERMQLRESVAQLRAQVAEQQNEIALAMADLKAANVKSTLVDTIQSQRKTEIERLTKLYESQIASLRKVIEIRNEAILAFQTHLIAIRSMLEGAYIPPSLEIQSRPFPLDSSKQASQSERSKHEGVLSGRVLSVDQKNRFIVIDLGPAQGAQQGRSVEVYKNGGLIGEARIDRVYENLSAATVLSNFVLQQVEEGDQVSLG